MASSCAKPAIAKNGFRRKNKNHNSKKMRKEIPVIEMREARKNNYVVNFLTGVPGLLSHRCFWLTFSPVIIAHDGVWRQGEEAPTDAVLRGRLCGWR
jgi:hypothetical protein